MGPTRVCSQRGVEGTETPPGVLPTLLPVLFLPLFREAGACGRKVMSAKKLTHQSPEQEVSTYRSKHSPESGS